MSEKGKKLLIIAVVVMALAFVGLYIISGSTSQTAGIVRTKASPASDRPPPAALFDEEHMAVVDSHERPLPAATLSRKLQEMASNKYIANRMGEAINLWQLSVYLNENNVLSKRRLHDVTGQLDAIIQEMIALGNHDYTYLRYKRAIYHWEKVLNLMPDKDSPVYLKTVQKIAMAKRKMRR